MIIAYIYKTPFLSRSHNALQLYTSSTKYDAQVLQSNRVKHNLLTKHTHTGLHKHTHIHNQSINQWILQLYVNISFSFPFYPVRSVQSLFMHFRQFMSVYMYTRLAKHFRQLMPVYMAPVLQMAVQSCALDRLHVSICCRWQFSG